MAITKKIKMLFDSKLTNSLPPSSGDGVVSFQIEDTGNERVTDMASGEVVDISPNVTNGILTASAQAFQSSMADGMRSGNFNMAALQSVALKNLDEVGAVESSSTKKILDTTN